MNGTDERQSDSEEYQRLRWYNLASNVRSWNNFEIPTETLSEYLNQK